MRKLVWTKLKSPFSRAGRSPKERDHDSLSNKLNVNEEYKEAFRTKSYVEMWSKVQGQLRRTRIDGVNRLSSSSSSSSSSSPLPFYVHLSDYLFEPQEQETLKEMIESLKFHQLLADYFESSLEACNICDLLLRAIRQIRANYKSIKRVIKLSKRVQDSSDYTDNKIWGAIFGELAAYALLKNPLLPFVSTGKFRDFHDTNMVLFHGLTSEHRKITRRAKFKRICKKVGGCCLMISHTALVIALLVIAIYGMVGIIAAPGVVGFSLCLFRKQIKLVHGGSKTRLLEKRICAQLDLAAKGTYILINDFDTISTLVMRLYEEMEHLKALAEICVRNKKIELLKEVVKEFLIRNSCYLEQLEELERHICLCFHTINRSRRLVIEETMATINNNEADGHRRNPHEAEDNLLRNSENR